jgi:hypothetical protein
MDPTTQPLWDYSVRYVLILMELRNRRMVPVAVTASPTLPWVKRRIREAAPFGLVSRFFVHDNHGIFGQFGRRRPGKSRMSYRSALDRWLGEEDHHCRTVAAFTTITGSPHSSGSAADSATVAPADPVDSGDGRRGPQPRDPIPQAGGSHLTRHWQGVQDPFRGLL